MAKKGLYGWETHTWRQEFEKEAKKALRFAVNGLVVVGLFTLAILQFDAVREIGFFTISERGILIIRSLMEFFLGTDSVYFALSIFASSVVLFLPFAVIFSVVGFLLAKKVVVFLFIRKELLYAGVEPECRLQSVRPCIKENILYNFARLRI